jgi:hypothetical protein
MPQTLLRHCVGLAASQRLAMHLCGLIERLGDNLLLRAYPSTWRNKRRRPLLAGLGIEHSSQSARQLRGLLTYAAPAQTRKPCCAPYACA